MLSAPSMMNRFSPEDAPSIEMPLSLALSWLAPGAWVTSDVKSRPFGIFSICSSRRLVLRALWVIAMSGDSATTWTVSVSPPGVSDRLMTLRSPRRRSTFCTFAGAKPDRLAVTS